MIPASTCKNTHRIKICKERFLLLHTVTQDRRTENRMRSRQAKCRNRSEQMSPWRWRKTLLKKNRIGAMQTEEFPSRRTTGAQEQKLMAEKLIHNSDRSIGSRKFQGGCGLLCARTKYERSGWQTDGHTGEAQD
jgi:hypothetical protein